MKYFSILFSVFLFGQNAPLAIKINSIVANDSLSNRRIYSINYQVENNTNQELQFFLNPTSLIAQAASSLTLFTVYKMYRNGAFDAMDGPFYEKMYPEQDEIKSMQDSQSPESKKFIAEIVDKISRTKKEYLENYKANGGTSTDEAWIYKNQSLLKTVISLKPREVKNFTIATSWWRNRYFKIEDNEFYLNENDKFEIQFALILNKSDRGDALSEKEFSKIKNNPNFIEGTFLSNLIEISFN